MKKDEIHSIRNKSLIYLSIAFTAVVIIVFFSVRILAEHGLTDLEQQNASLQVDRVDSTFTFLLDSMQNTAQDWGVWDDTYDYINGSNPDYPENNLFADAFDNLGISLVIFYDSEGSVVHSTEYDFDAGTEIPVEAVLLAEIANIGIPDNNAADFQISGMISTSAGVYAIVSSPILRSDHTGEAMGNLVFGQLLGDAEIDYLKEVSGVDFYFAENTAMISASQLIIEDTSNGQLLVTSVLVDLSDKQDVVMKLLIPADYAAVMDGTMYDLVWTLVITTFTLLGLTMFLLNKYIISRLEKLSGNIQYLSNNKNFNGRLPLDQNHDEISYISNEINILLTELHASEQEINKLAYMDYLTQQPNRLQLYNLMDQALLEATSSGATIAVLFIDIDFFKTVNDQFGHAIGDEFLIEVTKRMLSVTTGSETLARTGGDEFVILSRDTTEDQVTALCHDIIHAMKDKVRVREHEIKITVSIGVSLFPKNSVDRDQLITLADDAMYQAKALGKNTYWLSEEKIK